jgi:hypothetical protein
MRTRAFFWRIASGGRMGRSARMSIVCLAATTGWACAGTFAPPMSLPGGPLRASDQDLARVVFLWPPTSCDAAGHYTIVDDTGRFLGNITSGTRVSVDVSQGSHTFLAWNPRREADQGTPTAIEVAVMHATVFKGATYYVQVAFGEWGMRGPVTSYSRPRWGLGMHRRCASRDPVLLAATSGPQLELWMQRLEAYEPDLGQGQRWLDQDPATTQEHIEIANRRWSRILPADRPLVTLYPDDGVKEQH